MNERTQRNVLLLVIGATTALLGFVYGLQVHQSALGWAAVTAVVGLVSGRVLLGFETRKGRSLLANLVLGTLLGLFLGLLAGLPAAALGAMAGEVSALLVTGLAGGRQVSEG